MLGWSGGTRLQRSAIAAMTAMTATAASASIAFADVASDASEQDRTIAADLFDRGVKKMDEGRCDDAHIVRAPAQEQACGEAIDLFRRAFELYPAALGALRNLAYSEKGVGRLASAARDFRELAREAPLDAKPERRLWADYARKEADALEPRIPHLVVKMPLDRPPVTRVTLDGKALPEAAWGTRIDVDPGEHVVAAEAADRTPFRASVTIVERDDKTVVVVLAESADATAASHPHDVAPVVVRGASPLPWFITGAGMVVTGVGLGFGYAALQKKSSACQDKLCDPHGLSQGRSLATVSTIVTSAGGAIFVTGVIWLIARPSTRESRATGISLVPYASTDGGGLAAFGSF